MRAIDADRLCVDLMERWDIADKQKEELIRRVMADIVTPIVVSQPTIEPERKKGKWIMKYKGSAVTSYKCSECGRTVRDDTGYDVSKDYPFCHCGADMRGDDDD